MLKLHLQAATSILNTPFGGSSPPRYLVPEYRVVGSEMRKSFKIIGAPPFAPLAMLTWRGDTSNLLFLLTWRHLQDT